MQINIRLFFNRVPKAVSTHSHITAQASVYYPCDEMFSALQAPPQQAAGSDSDCELLPAPQALAVVAVPGALPLAPATAQQNTAVDTKTGDFPWPANNSSGKFYLFTQVEEDGPPRPGRKTPTEVGREGLWLALKAAYAAVFQQGHACHTGPVFGKVVQEGHPNSAELSRQRLHNHGACAFAADHRWKAVEKNLREVQGVKVRGSLWVFL